MLKGIQFVVNEQGEKTAVQIDFEITFARSARKEFEKLPAQEVKGMSQANRGQNLWRIRIGEYRVVYFIDDERQMVDIVAVRHRSEAYR
ncbi:MAG: type II toxin-antitoxin system RelE/ParE family toxin [Chloroflexota bacterium]